MTVIRHADTRRTDTPNAQMTTLASPTQGGAAMVMWRVVMHPGQAGPLHGVDAEQVWTVLAGGANVLLDGDTHVVAPGDTLVMPADVPRQVTCAVDTPFEAIVVAPAGMRAYMVDPAAGVVPSEVADADKLTPAWTV